jgi:hypothetical protein
MLEPPQSTEAIAKNQKSLSLPSSEISGLHPANQPNRTYKLTFFQKCAKKSISGSSTVLENFTKFELLTPKLSKIDSHIIKIIHIKF